MCRRIEEELINAEREAIDGAWMGLNGQGDVFTPSFVTSGGEEIHERRREEAVEDPLEKLTALCANDLVKAFKLDSAPGPWSFLAAPPARRFAREILEFDHTVGRDGLPAGARYILQRYTASTDCAGADAVPRSGPLLVVSNHPGMVDAMAVWSAVGRDDLKTVAAERGLLQQLKRTRERLIVIGDYPAKAIREAARALLAGNAVLTFPAGHIEPDPAIRPGALASLDEWSCSPAAFERLVPGLAIVPVLVQGVIHPGAARLPLLRYLRNPKDRDWAGATLQILLPAYRRVHVRLQFGRPTSRYADALEQMRSLAAETSLERVLATPLR